MPGYRRQLTHVKWCSAKRTCALMSVDIFRFQLFKRRAQQQLWLILAVTNSLYKKGILYICEGVCLTVTISHVACDSTWPRPVICVFLVYIIAILSYLQVDGVFPHPRWGWSCGTGRRRPRQGHWGTPKPETPRAGGTGTSTSLDEDKTISKNWHRKTRTLRREGKKRLSICEH